LANVETWTTVDACFEPAAAVFAVAADEAATVFVVVETLDIAITQELTVLRRAVARHGYPALKLQFWCHPGDTPHRREINKK